MIVKELNEKDLYKLFRDFVRFFPNKDNPCERLNTFAVLNDLTQLNSDNFNKTVKDKDKLYFWSRDWAKHGYSNSHIKVQYPALIVGLDSIINAKDKLRYVFEILVLDTYAADKKGKSTKYCSNRTIEDVFCNTRNLFLQLIKYLENVVYVNGYGLMNGTVFNYLVDEGILSDDVTTCKSTGKYISKELCKAFNRIEMNRFEYGHDCITGQIMSFINIDIPNCIKFDYEPTIIKKDLKKIDDLKILL